MRRNKRQWEAYKKSILTKQSKQESKKNGKLTKKILKTSEIKIKMMIT